MPTRPPETATPPRWKNDDVSRGVYKKPIAKTPSASMYLPSMKFRAPSFSIEPLENRIAPATILVGNASASPHNVGYADSPFATVASNSSFAAAVGDTTDGFYLTLHAGDKIDLFNSGKGYTPFITVTKGTVVAFFVDKNSNGQVDASELTGLSLGNNVAMNVFGAVNGDVATDLNADGVTINSTGLNDFGIKSLSVSGGSINGSVYAGGAIQKLKVVGNVEQILTGTAANGDIIDYNGTNANGTNAFNITPLSGQAGPNIQNVTVGSIGFVDSGGASIANTGLIQAGDGGAGGKGGSLSNITITLDSDGFTLQAGNGGVGDSSHVNGGAGGGIANVYVNGVVDSTINDTVNITAGSGGAGNSLSTDKGGAGGGISNLHVGYIVGKGNPVLSSNLLSDDVFVHAGSGGDGGKAGAGGSISNSQISISTPDDSSVTNELVVQAGDGGSTLDGNAGKGGSVINVKANNFDNSATTAQLLVAAGDGGSVTSVTAGKGAAGGSVNTLTMIGFQVEADAGNGSKGVDAGGNGGSLNGITVGSSNVSTIINNSTILNAGYGGDTQNGKAGNGGNVINLSIKDASFGDSDFSDSTQMGLIINAGSSNTAGNGGDSTNGIGGAGGSISNFIVTTQTLVTNGGYFTMRAGDGGAGDTHGGAGGSITLIKSQTENVSLSATAGSGGSASAGKGGVGGGFDTVSFINEGSVNSADATASLVAGAGGGASGSNGGAGGSLLNVSSIATGDVLLQAGAGGSGDATVGHAGNGGGIGNASGESFDGNTSAIAGDAGASGAKAGIGGSISSVNVLGENNVTITAGNGSNGGAGGNVTSVGFSGGNFATSPFGTTVITAGNGSVSTDHTTSGAGGSINGLTGYIGRFGNTTIAAGSVSGSSVKGAAGGSVTNVTLLGDYDPSNDVPSDIAVVTIAAGDASDATSAKVGADGGKVSGVTVLGSNGKTSGVDPSTLIRSIAAGNGGGGALVGGAGGSVTAIHARNLDIGVRDGISYGYSTMGGIFAGVGGSGANASGSNGSVISVTANAIAAIVAGKGASPDLVAVADKIYLNGLTVPTFDSNGAYTNIDTANIVGGVSDSARSDAYQFQYLDSTSTLQTNTSTTPVLWNSSSTPVDGLIAAAKITNNRNFTAGAVLTYNSSGQIVLEDASNV